MVRTPRSASRRSHGATRSAASEAAIIGAAKVVLQEEGFENFTIEAVAKLARSSKPTIYKWWAGKLDLALDVYTREWIFNNLPSSRDLKRDLVELCDKFWAVWWSEPHTASLTRSLLAAVIENRIDQSHLRLKFFEMHEQPFRNFLRDAANRGEINQSKVDVLAYMLCAFNVQRLALGQPPRQDEIEIAVDCIVLAARANDILI